MPEETNVLRENEIKANRIMAGTMLLSFFVVILTIVLVKIDYFQQPRISYWLPLMLFIEILLLAARSCTGSGKGSRRG